MKSTPTASASARRVHLFSRRSSRNRWPNSTGFRSPEWFSSSCVDTGIRRRCVEVNTSRAGVLASSAGRATDLVAGNQFLPRFVEASYELVTKHAASPKLLVCLGLRSRKASDGRAIRSSSLPGTKLFVCYGRLMGSRVTAGNTRWFGRG